MARVKPEKLESVWGVSFSSFRSKAIMNEYEKEEWNAAFVHHYVHYSFAPTWNYVFKQLYNNEQTHALEKVKQHLPHTQPGNDVMVTVCILVSRLLAN